MLSRLLFVLLLSTGALAQPVATNQCAPGRQCRARTFISDQASGSISFQLERGARIDYDATNTGSAFQIYSDGTWLRTNSAWYANGVIGTSTYFNSDIAAGANAYACTNTGCRLQLGSSLRYLSDDGTNFLLTGAGLVPSADWTYSLGNNSYRWKNLYVGSLYDDNSVRLTLTGGGSNVYVDDVASPGASSVAHELTTKNAYATAGGKLLSVQNVTTEKFAVYHDGSTQQEFSDLPTCGADTEGRLVIDSARGTTSGVRTGLCLCTSNGAGTPVYAWIDLATGTVGTTTTCPNA